MSSFDGRPKKFYGEEQEQIADGTYGKIIITDKGYIIKRINILGYINLPPDVINEISSVILFDNPTIVRYHDFFLTKDYVDIIMDFAVSDLFGLITMRKPTMVEKKEIIWQLINGLSDIVNRNIIHKDIKPQNILVYKSNGLFEYPIKYADFGLASFNDCLGRDHKSIAYSLWYRPPENMNMQFENFSYKSDTWALGCTIYEIWTKTPLFRAHNESEMIRQIKKLKDQKIAALTDQNLRKMLDSMLKNDPDQRADIFELQVDPFFDQLFENNPYYEKNIIQPISCLDKIISMKLIDNSNFDQINDELNYKLATRISVLMADTNGKIFLPSRVYDLAISILRMFLIEHPRYLDNSKIPEDNISNILLIFKVAIFVAVKASDMNEDYFEYFDPRKNLFFKYNEVNIINQYNGMIYQASKFKFFNTLPTDYIEHIGLKYTKQVVNMTLKTMLFLKCFLAGPGLLDRFYSDYLEMSEDLLALHNFLLNDVIGPEKVTEKMRSVADFLLQDIIFAAFNSEYSDVLTIKIEQNLIKIINFEKF